MEGQEAKVQNFWTSFGQLTVDNFFFCEIVPTAPLVFHCDDERTDGRPCPKFLDANRIFGRPRHPNLWAHNWPDVRFVQWMSGRTDGWMNQKMRFSRGKKIFLCNTLCNMDEAMPSPEVEEKSCTNAAARLILALKTLPKIMMLMKMIRNRRSRNSQFIS
jgi:hypothetical protein